MSGRVTYQGRPLAGADISFVPVDGERSATARTDEDGNYRLGTMELDDGAVVGLHRVQIIARGPPKPLAAGEFGSGLPGDMKEGDPLIPLKYFSMDTSGLERKVLEGQSNEFNFEL